MKKLIVILGVFLSMCTIQVFAADSIIRASAEGDLDAVARMIAAGVDLETEAVMIEGFQECRATPVLFAARGGHWDVVDVLLLAGARADVQDSKGKNLVMYAVGQANLPVLTKLLDSTIIDVRQTDSRNQNALSYALGIDFKEACDIVDFLFKKGINFPRPGALPNWQQVDLDRIIKAINKKRHEYNKTIATIRKKVVPKLGLPIETYKKEILPHFDEQQPLLPLASQVYKTGQGPNWGPAHTTMEL